MILLISILRIKKLKFINVALEAAKNAEQFLKESQEKPEKIISEVENISSERNSRKSSNQ